jgi:DNA polymerase III sliding clamp (beta) subunit (PCNA family)
MTKVGGKMIDYKTFMAHAAKVCGSAHLKLTDKHKMLRGVKHFESGNAVATDAHRLYFAQAIHDRNDSAVITPKGKVLEGDYPDVSRLIPDSGNAKQELEIDVGEMLKGADIIASLGKIIEPVPSIKLQENELYFYSVEMKIRYFLDVKFEESLWLNAQYLLDAMKLFKAAKCQKAIFRYYGRVRPITLTNDEESLLALILPIRKY